MTPMTPQRYSEDVAKQILKQAVALEPTQHDFSRDELLSMADELDIPREQVLAAEQKWLAGQQVDEERLAFKQHRQQEFRNHLASYVMVNIFLLLINIFTGGSWWFYWVLLSWGLGLAMHAWRTYQSGGEEYEKEFEEWRVKRLTTGTK